jgi:hypothetical protein
MSSGRASVDTVREETPKHYSVLSKLVHYTAKFTPDDDGRHSNLRTLSKNYRRQSTLDIADRFVFRLYLRLQIRIS